MSKPSEKKTSVQPVAKTASSIAGPMMDTAVLHTKYDLGLVQALLPEVVQNDFEGLKRHTIIRCFEQTHPATTELCVLGVFCMPFEHKATRSSAMLTNVGSIGQYAQCIDISGKTQTSWFTMTDHKITPSVAYRVEWKKLLVYHFDETHGHLVINGIDTRALPVEKKEK